MAVKKKKPEDLQARVDDLEARMEQMKQGLQQVLELMGGMVEE